MARLGAIAILLLACSTGHACNVPVFRYALERWNKRQPDDLYSLYVFYDGRQPSADALLRELADLEKRLDDPARLANLLVYQVDAAKEIGSDFIRKQYEKHRPRGEALEPFMVLRLPETWGIDRPLYAGPYDLTVIDAFLHSPLRQTIARRILQGYSAVFLFLESGDKAKDEEKLAFVEAELAKLQREVPLPEPSENPKDKLTRADPLLKVDFAILRLSRQDNLEKKLVQMLLAMDEDDYIGKVKEPVLIPIYGRGIAMVNECLIGKGINEANLGALVRFLLGPCSCEIRRLNPGIELLMAVDWDGTPPPEPDATSVSASVRGDAESQQAPPPAADSFRIWRNLIWALGGLLVLVLLGSMLVFARRK